MLRRNRRSAISGMFFVAVVFFLFLWINFPGVFLIHNVILGSLRVLLLLWLRRFLGSVVVCKITDSFVILGRILIVWNLSRIITWKRLCTFYESHEENLLLNMAQLGSKISFVMITAVLL